MTGYCKKHNYPLNVFGGCLKCDGEEKIHSEFCSQAILEYRKTVAKLKSALADKDKRIEELEAAMQIMAKGNIKAKSYKDVYDMAENYSVLVDNKESSTAYYVGFKAAVFECKIIAEQALKKGKGGK